MNIFIAANIRWNSKCVFLKYIAQKRAELNRPGGEAI